MNEWHTKECSIKPYEGDIVLVRLSYKLGYAPFLAFYANGKFIHDPTLEDLTSHVKWWCRITQPHHTCITKGAENGS